jgi:holo-[acyl-carrier protein] synthase
MLPDNLDRDHASPGATVGIGLDLVDIDRMRETLDRWGARFVERIFADSERIPLDEPRAAQHYAARFAAKEAFAKALGTGFDEGVSWRDVRVRNAPSGAPSIDLHARAAELADRHHVGRVHLSISHSRSTAAAIVVLDRRLEPDAND